MAEGKEEQVTSYLDGSRQRACAGKLPFLKLSDLLRLIHHHENAQERLSLVIQLPPTGSLPQCMGIVGDTIQVEIWVGTQANHIILPRTPSQISCPHISKPIVPSQQSPKLISALTQKSTVQSLI